jgi:polyisoprenoid-binding protein YceI
MKVFNGIAFSMLAAAALWLAAPTASMAEPVVYQIDPAHSQVIFKVKHLGISNVTGRFDIFEGSYTFDSDNAANSKVEATISAASVNTNEADRDKHLRSDEFLNVEKHPNITFKSKSVTKDPGDSDDYTIVGDLTINGVTKEVELDAEYGGKTTDPWGNGRTAFEAETKINRKDFGLTWNKTLDAGGLVVGDEVKITLEVEGIHKKQ